MAAKRPDGLDLRRDTALWSAPRRTKPGGQPVYSALAIETCLTLGMVFRQPLRQTQGLICSIAKRLGVEIAVSSFSTLSRRANGLTLCVQSHAIGQAGIQLVSPSQRCKHRLSGNR